MKNNKISIISLGLILIGVICSCSTTKKSTTNNMVAKMEVKEPIDGVCDNDNVYVILPFLGKGQVKAVAPLSNQEITADLNSKVIYLKDKPDYEDKGMVNLIVNCKGELVSCQIDNKTKSPELDAQIVAVFSNLKIWKAAIVNNKSVDSAVLYSFTIKNGTITVN